MNRTAMAVSVAVANVVDRALVLQNALARELADTGIKVLGVSHAVADSGERFLVEVENSGQVTNLYVDVSVKACQ